MDPFDRPEQRPFDMFAQYRAVTPGDNRRTPLEVLAAEQRIVTFADALLTWMREMQPELGQSPEMAGFFTHERGNPLAAQPGDGYDPVSKEPVKHMVLDKMDRDANRLMLDLLRAAWERRTWQAYHGLRSNVT